VIVLVVSVVAVVALFAVVWHTTSPSSSTSSSSASPSSPSAIVSKEPSSSVSTPSGSTSSSNVESVDTPVASGVATSGGAPDYYASINPNLPSNAFKHALHQLIYNKTRLTYNQIWTAFETTDLAPRIPYPCQQGLVDPYSSKCWTLNERCGNYKKEGDCFNREHTWPKSWWGGGDTVDGAYTDLFHLRPTDGYVNGRRSNYCLGEVDPNQKPTYTSTSGAVLGQSAGYTGFEGLVFQPPAEERGDFARNYFYMSICYMDVFTCCDSDGVNGSHIKPWLLNLLRAWHVYDPPSVGERQRNELVYGIQHNRNPFIDHPEWVSLIQDF